MCFFQCCFQVGRHDVLTCVQPFIKHFLYNILLVRADPDDRGGHRCGVKTACYMVNPDLILLRQRWKNILPLSVYELELEGLSGSFSFGTKCQNKKNYAGVPFALLLIPPKKLRHKYSTLTSFEYLERWNFPALRTALPRCHCPRPRPPLSEPESKAPKIHSRESPL